MTKRKTKEDPYLLFKFSTGFIILLFLIGFFILMPLAPERDGDPNTRNVSGIVLKKIKRNSDRGYRFYEIKQGDKILDIWGIYITKDLNIVEPGDSLYFVPGSKVIKIFGKDSNYTVMRYYPTVSK